MSEETTEEVPQTAAEKIKAALRKSVGNSGNSESQRYVAEKRAFIQDRTRQLFDYEDAALSDLPRLRAQAEAEFDQRERDNLANSRAKANRQSYNSSNDNAQNEYQGRWYDSPERAWHAQNSTPGELKVLDALNDQYHRSRTNDDASDGGEE